MIWQLIGEPGNHAEESENPLPTGPQPIWLDPRTVTAERQAHAVLVPSIFRWQVG